MFSGEIHYFRMPEKVWELHVEKARKAGLNTISFYIPWRCHEYEEGKFDFEGRTDPQRNLVRFLKIVEDAGLYLSVRVGPVSNAEILGEGIPLWLLQNHPEIFAKNSRVPAYPEVTLLSYMCPLFLKYVGKWYDQLLPILRPHQISESGNLIMMQLCNEIAMTHWLAKGSDSADHVCQMYQDFLSEKYGNIDKLNKAYGVSYQKFDEIFQPEGDVSLETLHIFFDWALFYRRYYATYYHQLWKMARKQGIQVPLSANAPQFYDYDVRGRGVFSPMTTSMFRDFSRFSPSTIFGGAYQMRRLDFENFHDVPITTECTKLLDAESPTICAELQTGIMRDRPRLYASDVDLNIKTSAAHGLNGVNCYMFSSGVNPCGMGLFGTYHDWQAPLSLKGEEREHMAPIHEWGMFLKKHGAALAETTKVADTTLGFYLPYYATEYFTGSWASQIEFRRTQWFYDGFARLVQIAGYNFSICDLLASSREELRKHASLSVFSLEFMDEETQQKLADYVLAGGTLLLGPRLPTSNLKGESCLILAHTLKIQPHVSKERSMIHGHQTECAVEQPIQIFEAGHAVVHSKTAAGAPCVIQGSTAQRGQWLVYGFGMTHLFDYHVDMVREWMQWLGIPLSLRMDPADVHGVLRWGKDQGFLFLMNYHDATRDGEWTLHLQAQQLEPLTKSFHLDRRSSKVVILKRSGTRLHEFKGKQAAAILT